MVSLFRIFSILLILQAFHLMVYALFLDGSLLADLPSRLQVFSFRYCVYKLTQVRNHHQGLLHFSLNLQAGELQLSSMLIVSIVLQEKLFLQPLFALQPQAF